MHAVYAPAFRFSSVLGRLILVNVSVLVLQQVCAVWFGASFMERWFGLSWAGLSHGLLWTPLTYAFLHEGVGHLLVNMLVLFFAWRAVETEWGTRRCVWIYGASVLGGAFLWLLTTGSGFPYAELVGASAGAIGLFSAFCFLNWEKPVTFLLFFFLPLTIKPKWMFAFFAGVEVFSLLFRELPVRLGVGDGRMVGIAFSAHVGGIVAAWVCTRLFAARALGEARPSIQLPAWLRKRRGRVRGLVAYRVNYGKPLELNPREVNRVLDKIAAEGFATLTPEEKDLLDRAHAQMKKR